MSHQNVFSEPRKRSQGQVKFISATHLGKESRFSPSVAVKYAKECVLQVLLIGRLLVGHSKLIFHVLATALVLVARHPKVEPDAGRHNANQPQTLLDPCLAFDSTRSHV